jgi:hypothetical protein
MQRMRMICVHSVTPTPRCHSDTDNASVEQEKRLVAAEAAYWAKAGSVYPGDHSASGVPQLQHYKSMYQGFAGDGKTIKNPLLEVGRIWHVTTASNADHYKSM